MPGTKLRLLPHPADIIAADCLSHLLATVSIHDDDALRREAPRGLQNMCEQRASSMVALPAASRKATYFRPPSSYPSGPGESW